MENIKTVDEILNVLDTIGTDFPENVYLKLTFSDIESEEDVRKLAKQEKISLFEPCAGLPFLWTQWEISKELSVTIRCKKVNYVLG